MLGSFRASMYRSMNTVTGRRVVAATSAGLLSMATFKMANQAGHGDHGDGHKEHPEVPYMVRDSIILRQDPIKLQEAKSKNHFWMSLSSLAYVYGLYRIYQYFAKAGISKTVLGASIGTVGFISLGLAWATPGGNIVTEMALNRDLRTMSLRTGLLNSETHIVNINEIRPVTSKDLIAFSAPSDKGNSRVVYYLPDLSNLEKSNYKVSHNQLLRDLITGNADNVARYKFKQ